MQASAPSSSIVAVGGLLHRQIRLEVTRDQGVRPGLQQADAQRGTVAAARVQSWSGLPRQLMPEKVPVVQFAGDLQIQRRLGHLSGLDHPIQPVLVVRRGALLDVFERGLLAERLELDDRGVEADQRLIRTRGDHERQAVAMCLRQGDSNPVRTVVAVGVPIGERLFEPVRDDDDLVVPDQLAPDLVRLDRRERGVRDVAGESLLGQPREVEVIVGVAQADRHGDGTLLGEALRQLEQHGRLAGTDAPEDHVRSAAGAIAQVVHDHVADLLASDHVSDDRSGRRQQLARLGPCALDVRPTDTAQPPEDEHARHEREREKGRRHAVDDSARVAHLLAATARTRPSRRTVDPLLAARDPADIASDGSDPVARPLCLASVE
jgi:hypothetical protein